MRRKPEGSTAAGKKSGSLVDIECSLHVTDRYKASVSGSATEGQSEDGNGITPTESRLDRICVGPGHPLTEQDVKLKPPAVGREFSDIARQVFGAII